MTPRDSRESQPDSLDKTVTLNGLSGVFRAGGLETTTVRGDLRDGPLIRPNQRDCLRPDPGRPPLPW